MGLRSRLGHEVRGLMNRISSLIEETSESSLALSATRGHSEKTAIHEPGSGFFPDSESTSDLELLSLQNYEKYHPAHGILAITAQSD